MKIFNERVFKKLPDAILFDTDNTLYPYDLSNLKSRILDVNTYKDWKQLTKLYNSRNE